MAKTTRFKRFLENKVTYLLAAILGALIGMMWPSIGHPLGEVAKIALHILQMCILPIVITSIAVSIAHFMRVKSSLNPWRVISTLVLAILLCGLIGTGGGLLTEPGNNLNFSSNEELQQMITKSTQEVKGMQDPVEERIVTGLAEMIQDFIPENIFQSLSSNRLLQIVVFSIILGFGLGKFMEEGAFLVHLIRQIRVLFTELFEWFLEYFPIVLVMLVAGQVSMLGPEPILAMGKFIAKFYLVILCVTVVSILWIKYNTRIRWRELFSIVSNPVIVAFVTQSSNNAIPPSIEALRRMNYDKELVHLMVPLGSILGRFGEIIYFGFCIIFALEIYGIDLTVNHFFLISLVTVMSGISSAGRDEVSLMLEALILTLAPMGIPLEGVLPLFLAIDLFIDPLRTATTTLVNLSAITAMAKPLGAPIAQEEFEKEELAILKNHGQ